MIEISKPFLVALAIIILVFGIIALPLSIRQCLAYSEPNIENERMRTAIKFCLTFDLSLFVLIANLYLGILLKEFVFAHSG